MQKPKKSAMLFSVVIPSWTQDKLVVSTTEWLPWLQTNWKDSGYGMFALLLETNCIRQPKGQLPRSSYNHNNHGVR